MELNKYMMNFDSGYAECFKAKSERAAKSYATKALTHGGGGVNLYLIDEGSQVFIGFRNMWQSLNSFGWDKWSL